MAERARRAGTLKGKRPAGKSGTGRPGQKHRKAGPEKSSQAKAPPSAKQSEPATKTTAGKGPRSTAVVLRRVRPMSLLRISVLFYLSLCLALFIASVLLWAGANAIGLVGNVEGFMDEIGFTDFRLRPGPLLAGSALFSVVLVFAGSLANFLMAVLYNLIADVVGGIKVVLTEDPETPRK